MTLVDGAELTAVGRTWRILDDPEHQWRLQDRVGDAWRDLYLFDESTTYPSDVDVANFWIANCPASPFLNTALVVRHTPEGRVTLLNRTTSHYLGQARQQSEIDTPDTFRRFLHDDLAVKLPSDSHGWSTLWQKIAPDAPPIDW